MVSGLSWNADKRTHPNLANADIVVTHQFVWNGNRPPFPGVTKATNSKFVLRDYTENSPNVKLVLTGDNHQTFTFTDDRAVLVNPGSLLRLTVDQQEHHPAVFLWRHEDAVLKRVPVPFKADVFDTEIAPERDAIASFTDFINQVKAQKHIGGGTFADRIRGLVESCYPAVKTKIRQWMEEDHGND
jgi:hypothetical protein